MFEKVAVDGATYEIDTDYNTRGQPSSLTYPDGSSVDYAPDAFGEPTKIGTFATALAYWPNGAVKSFTYGNGAGNVTAITDQLAGHPDSVLMSYCDRPRQRPTE
jgi:hypothetical protein